MATVCVRLAGPSLPCKRRTACAAGTHSESRTPALPPSPAAKPNTGMSETALLSHHTCQTAAENALQKINRPRPHEDQIFDQSEKGKKGKRERGLMCKGRGGGLEKEEDGDG